MQKIKTLLFFMACSLTSLLWAASSPVPMLETAANQILSTLEKNKASLKNNPQVIYRAVEQSLLPNVDVSGMSRSVLGRQAWMKATPSERQQFSQAFTQLVIRTYASPLAEYTDETVKFLPVRGSLEGRFLRVNSLIVRSNGKNIPLTYSLVVKNGEWKIYDLSVEGVSLLQSFRSQFAQALQNSNMQDLIKQMRERSKKAA
ncbi:ABC transporter substrate-binding protein [Legionella taurinensis]|uniref:ABC transporter substrate-binding protein n=1 Tax=Legionella taurinensis TaxID=70611 RepID=A0AB38N840_9GAMM|nr:ABC transporter substrate-binding protein [Legionella taurinensis]MDX1836710.1 ABC transporter substrate-binding protein [Legionella taurinensis]PUT42836.1 signal peptidase [Legionella taurinensis]PUT45391.1 signal peptidase [Legionella taurinensis]PUT47034.1 signal peptidase [Legionella taurinensis]PUT49158.1 signal peptidase [Legionella taurinensis]